MTTVGLLMIDDILKEWVAARTELARVEAELVKVGLHVLLSKTPTNIDLPSPEKSPSVVSMVQEAAKTLTPPFWFKEIAAAILAKYPEHKSKVKRGVYAATNHLINKGFFERVPDGIRIVVKEEPNNQVESESGSS